MHPHPNATELDAFDHGQLPRGRWAEVEGHVAECDACCQYLQKVPDDSLVALLKSSSNTPHFSSMASHATPTAVFPASRTAARGNEPPAELADHPRYRVVKWLGAGGMGTVFQAEHRLMQRLVALKVIHADLLERPEVVERFQHEVRAAGRLSHPNIAIAYDADRAGDVHFLVMEFAEGRSLDKILVSRGPLPWREACGLMTQAAQGLQHAFERGMVHRDLKPANLLVTADGRLKILDFGLARLVSETLLARPLTPVGAVVGTPHYLAPEQAREPQSADIRADLYSLGCTWYEMLTGQPPFPSASLLQQLLSHQDRAVRPVTEFRADVPPPMVAIVDRLLEKDPARRFQTPSDLLVAIKPWSESGVSAAPSRFGLQWIVAAACGLLVVIGLAIAWTMRTREPEERPNVVAKVEVEKAKDPPQPKPQPKPQIKTVPAADRALAWLQTNNTLDPDFEGKKLISDHRRQIYGIPDDRAFVLRLQEKLVKSNRPTLLAGRGADFFVFELTPGDLAMPKFNAVMNVSPKQEHVFEAEPTIQLSDLRFDQKTLDGALSGSVSYAAQKAVSGKLALRLTFSGPWTTTTFYKVLDEPSLAGQGSLPFRFASFKETLKKGNAAVLFLDVCEMDAAARQVIYSNDVAKAFVGEAP